MLDIEFLLAPLPIDSMMIYRYRTGILRQRLLRYLDYIARKSAAILTHYEPRELESTWFAPTLFDEIRICGLGDEKITRHSFRKLMVLAAHAPAARTIIVVRASSSVDRAPDGVFHVEEPIVTKSNIARVLEFVAAATDLVEPGGLLKQTAFRSHFRRWIDERGRARLPDVIQEFDRSVLLFSDIQSGEFAPSPREEADPTDSSLLTGSLRRFLAFDGAFERADLLRALALRTEKGWSAVNLVKDLLVASRRVAETAARGPGKVAEEAALLWCSLLLPWSMQFVEEQPLAQHISALVEFENLSRDFSRSLDELAGDPLAGYWNRLSATFQSIWNIEEQDEEVDARKELLRWISVTRGKMKEYRWINKLHRTTAEVHVSESVSSDSTSHAVNAAPALDHLADVKGHKAVIRELAERFRSGRHDRPLLLAGPEGIGKRTLGRLYAKALLCEREDNSRIEPCGACLCCKTFEENGAFNYVELDLAEDHALSLVHGLLDMLKYIPWNRRRVVILKNADSSSEVLDDILTTLEGGAEITSIVLLVQDVRHVAPAALSRSAVFQLRRLSEIDAKNLVSQWFRHDRVDDAVVELIMMHGGGLPGAMYTLCQEAISSSISTLEEAKALFGLNWGAGVLRYWQALLSGTLDRSALDDANPVETIRRVRTALCHLSTSTKTFEPAFYGLEMRMDELRANFERSAASLGRNFEDVYTELARHWLNDGIIDSESLIEVSVKTCNILCARARVMGQLPSGLPETS